MDDELIHLERLRQEAEDAASAVHLDLPDSIGPVIGALSRLRDYIEEMDEEGLLPPSPEEEER